MSGTKEYFIVDFDSTFVQVEALDELARIVLKNNKNKNSILKNFRRITREGMEGRISFSESLEKRLALIKIHRNNINELITYLKNHVSPSIKRNRKFFGTYSEQIYIITGGFKEYTIPVVEEYGIKNQNVMANTFVFDKDGYVVGFDKDNPLCKENGKVEIVKKLHLNGDIYGIGDGYTDFKMKESGLVSKFYVFTENVRRENVLVKADYVLPSFDEFLYINKLPMSISYPKNRIKVLLLENIHRDAYKRFAEEGYSVEVMSGSLSEKKLIKLIEDVSVIGIRSKTKISNEILKHAKRLHAIGAFCIGTNQIDLRACNEKGVVVFNAPFSNTRSVVELVIAEIIMLSRNIPERNAEMHDGKWNKMAEGCREIRGKKLGIIGYGKIGSQVSVLAENLGMSVFYYDITERLSLGNAQACKSMQEILRKCDVITVHVDGREENYHLFSFDEFNMMKKGVIFLNLSRGFVVDTEALVYFLKKGKIKGAAIDVFEKEPPSKGNAFSSELIGLPNVILTPHIGGSTMEAQKDIANYVPPKIIDYFNTGSSSGSVNFPEIKLQPVRKAHRLLHIHKNTPGVLAQINSIMSKYNSNIVSQQLKTNEDIGYVITDVDRRYDRNIIRELKQIPETIRFRILY